MRSIAPTGQRERWGGETQSGQRERTVISRSEKKVHWAFPGFGGLHVELNKHVQKKWGGVTVLVGVHLGSRKNLGDCI